jgi:hypothetical protein
MPRKRVAWSDDAFSGLCDADEGRGALGIPALSAHPSQADSRSPVGLTLQLRQDKRITNSHHEFPACGEGSLCLLQGLELKRRVEPCKPLQDDSCLLLASSLSSRNDRKRSLFREEPCTHSSHEKLPVCLHTMWDGQTCHDVSNPYMRDAAHVASTVGDGREVHDGCRGLGRD